MGCGVTMELADAEIQLFDQMQIGIAVISKEMNWVYINQAFTKISGFEVNDLTALSFLSWVNMSQSNFLSRTQHHNGQHIKIAHKFKEILYVEMFISNWKHDKYLLQVSKIHPLNQVQDQLYDLHQALYQEIQQSNRPMFVVRNNRIISINLALKTLTGHDETYLLDQPIEKLYFTPSINHLEPLNWLEMKEQFLSNTTPHKLYVMNHKGKKTPIEVSVVEPVPYIADYCCVVIENLSKESILQQQMVSQLEACRQVVDMSSESIFIFKNSKCYYANQAAVTLFNAKERQDLIGKHINFLFTELEGYIKPTETVKEYVEELNMKKLNGSNFEARLKMHSVHKNNQRIDYIIIQDITEENKVNKFLIHSEKLATAGKLAAGIAHEIRNPLTVIRGFLDLLEAEGEHNKYYEIISSEFVRIESILHELLILSKPNMIQHDVINPGKALSGVLSLIESQSIFYNIDLKVCIDENLPSMIGDINQLKQVFINIVRNAMEAMPQGGSLKILAFQENNKIVIMFHDTGIGIPKEMLNRLGEPFFTTKENGTGLGLMVCKQIIDEHGGELDIVSKEQLGTTLTIRFPI